MGRQASSSALVNARLAQELRFRQVREVVDDRAAGMWVKLLLLRSRWARGVAEDKDAGKWVNLLPLRSR